ncbi:DNA-directed RNA polymerase III subunit Rpc5 [Vararia minispora EC-137]|uniref:DNA-directed RNA polymerase III subunit Rpc5 n=1 Tax=Vararia minispora EC-137 TaxID=1314806 RepID=A0ACB8QRJ5_9AGAM|nr:DNA-directed RNA polymerase III subunit Rpc5 [Vararia minispora EC-137]
METIDDPVVATIPVHLSNALLPNVHVHQFPLLNRPLQVPPSAALSGKRITARLKSQARRLEIHVPVDTRSDVWNSEKAKELGAGRLADDREKNQDIGRTKLRDGEEPRLAEVRLRSEEIPPTCVTMLGVVRDRQLHLHPVNEIHQLRPTLTYLDALSRKTRHTRGDDSDSEGPPPDPDEPAPPPAPAKEKKPTGEAKDVQIAARKTDEKSSQGGLSTVRREMLTAIHAEEDEPWTDYEFFGAETTQSAEAYEAIFSQQIDELCCTSDMESFLRSI